MLPRGVVVDTEGTIYVTEQGKNRVTRWRKGAEKAEVIVGGDELGNEAHQLNAPVGLSFDCHEHLYVVDSWNNRVQRFSLK